MPRILNFPAFASDYRSASRTPRSTVRKYYSWAGYSEIQVTVIGETPKRYRVRFERSALRWSDGDIRLVPKIRSRI
jgi:hypothetical protein